MNHRILELEGCLLNPCFMIEESELQRKFQGRNKPGPEQLPSPGRGAHEAAIYSPFHLPPVNCGSACPELNMIR